MSELHCMRGMADLRPGHHACCIYASHEEFLAPVTPFTRAGLERNEAVFLAVSVATADTILKRLDAEGVDVDDYRGRGQLLGGISDDALAALVCLDAEQALEAVRSEVRQAKSADFSALRVITDARPQIRTDGQVLPYLQFVARMAERIPEHEFSSLTMYSRLETEPQILLQAIRLHPVVVIGDQVHANTFYVPPAELLGDGWQGAQVDRWLENLVERRHAEERVRLFRELLNQTFDAIFIADAPTGRILDCNHRACESLGYTREEMLTLRGRDIADVLPEGVRWRTLPDHLREAGPVVFDGVHKRKDGSQFAVEVGLQYIASGGRGYIVAVARDVSERKRLERQLQQAAKMEAIGQLAGGVAHDFNNILTGIRGYTDFALAALSPGSPAASDLAQVRDLADRAASLTRQLLAFGRRQAVETEVLDVNILIEDLLKMLERLIGEDIELAFDPSPDPAICHADPALVEQVLMNLVLNARDAVTGGGSITIRTARVQLHDRFVPAAIPGPHVMIAVEDDGMGMDEETRDRIFDPFFTTKDIGRGTGLGLATVYGIVTQHAGHVSVDSAPGDGTTFKVFLPEVSVEETQETPEAAPPRAGGGEAILVVEDERPVLDLVQRIVSGAGYEVVAASNATEAMGIFKDRRDEIKLLVEDVVMPGGNGPELFGELSRIQPNLKVLYISGYKPDDLADRGITEESQFLQKPFTPDDIKRRVREALDA